MYTQGSDVHHDAYPTNVPTVRDEDILEKDEKPYLTKANIEATSNQSTGDTSHVVLNSEREIVTHVISVDDDPTLNPWTLRALFLGLGLSAFGGSLGMFIFIAVVSSAYFTKQPRSIISNR